VLSRTQTRESAKEQNLFSFASFYIYPMSQTPSQKGSKAQYKWTDADTKEVKNFFQALDANDDGKISKIEAEKLGGKGLNKFFMDCDAVPLKHKSYEEYMNFRDRVFGF